MITIGRRLSLLTQGVGSVLPRSTGSRHGTSVSVIMLENLEKHGNKGEIVSVKRGFARNFLIPRKLAAYATEANRQKFSELKPNNVNTNTQA